MKKNKRERFTEADRLLGMRIRLLREKLSLTQKQLADELGLSIQQIQKYEKGTNRISAIYLKKISDFFKTSFNYFFNSPNILDTKGDSILKELEDRAYEQKIATDEQKIATDKQKIATDRLFKYIKSLNMGFKYKYKEGDKNE